jgi:endogenous inhibitor of DNA gyrase (YacG/DUF329 family)
MSLTIWFMSEERSSVAKCPKCGNDIPPRKFLSLTRFSSSVICPMCNSSLQWKNKGTGSLIGGVGGGVGGGIGALFAEWWVFTGDVAYIALVCATAVVVFFAAWGAMVKLTKFEIKGTS